MAEASLLCGYLIVGADELKRSRAVARMKARLEKSGMAAFNLDERDMTHDPQIADIIPSHGCRFSSRDSQWLRQAA